VTIGSTANTVPAMIPVVRPASRVPSTTVPAAAAPMAIALGSRTANSDVPNKPIQKCRKT
jgi:hypothetical protein